MSGGENRRPPGDESDAGSVEGGQRGRQRPDDDGGATTVLPSTADGRGGRSDDVATTAIPRQGEGDRDPQATTALPGGSGSTMDERATAVTGSPAAGASFGISTRSHRPGAAFAPDEIVAGRFEVIGFIAAGGMGEVYEVEDIELKKRIALKTIRPEIARDRDALDRFKREIHLSHQITHPNVCRIFDIFHHTREGADGGRETVTFLTMELLQGETLADRLRRTGPMTVDEALPLVRQMSAALAAAHKVGVVHRDFKTGNVILVPDRAEPTGVRVAVADFGLARSELSADAFAEVSKEEDKMVVGTPAYMAPEQVQSMTITPAADMYALGVVFYEMLTGRLPFLGDNPLETALKRLEEAPPSPRALAPDLDERWERVVLRLMARDPAARFADARELLDFLDDLDRERERRRLKRRFILPGIGLVALALIAGLLLSKLFAPSHDSVAVLGFKNLSGRAEADWMSTALSEMLVAEMAVGGELRVVPSESVARLKRELAIDRVETLPEDRLRQVGSILGSDLVLLGSYLAIGESGGGKVRLVVHVQDTSRGETVETFTATGSEGDLFALIEEASAGLRDFLSLRDVTEAERGAVRAAFPVDPEARRLYAMGLERARRHEIPAARELLEEAVAIEPDHPLPHSWLADAWLKLGFEGRAREEATRALELADGLPERQRQEVEARYYYTLSDWDREAEIYRSMWSEFPEELDYGLELAGALNRAGKSDEAMAVLDRLRQLPPPTGDSPRIDLGLANVADALADYETVLAAARRAVDKGRAAGTPLVVAAGLFQHSLALRALGRTEESLAAAREAKALYGDAGDRAGVAKTLVSIGNTLQRQSDLDGARGAYEEALAIRRETGLKSGISFALNNLASVLYAQGDLEGAGRLYEESLAIKEEIGDLPAVVNSLNNLANVLYAQGDLGGAANRYDQALTLAEDLGERSLQILALVNSAELLLSQGEPAAAVERTTRALELCEATGWKYAAAAARTYRAEALLARDLLDEAGADFAAAAEVAAEIGAGAIEAEARRGQGMVELEGGSPEGARDRARRAVDLAAAAGSAKDEALSLLVLARALAELGEGEAAVAAVERAATAAATSQNRQVELMSRIVARRLAAERGSGAEVAAARTALETLVRLTDEGGLVILHLESELALAAAEQAAGATTAARRRRAGVDQRATERGLDRLARRAREGR